jgi:hypothetical protein
VHFVGFILFITENARSKKKVFQSLQLNVLSYNKVKLQRLMPDDNVYALNMLFSSCLFSISSYNDCTEDCKQDTTNRGAGLCASASS